MMTVIKQCVIEEVMYTGNRRKYEANYSDDLFNKKYIDSFLKGAGIVLLAVGQDHIYLPELSDMQRKIIQCKRTRIRVSSGFRRKIKRLTGGSER